MTHSEALSQLMRVAGELVRCEGIPDPLSWQLRQSWEHDVSRMQADQIRRAKLIRDAVEALRKP